MFYCLTSVKTSLHHSDTIFLECEYTTIQLGGQLFQQYIVNMWAFVDQTRLAFLHFNQGHLCITLYSGLEDWLAVDNVGNP